MTLAEDHDAVLLDLDGTVVRGRAVIPGAVEATAALRSRGTAVAFVTNNASRSAQHVADELTASGIAAAPDEVVTSSQAAAALLADLLPAGSAVLVVGTAALADAVRAVGLEPVESADDAPAAVVQGHSPDTGWPRLAEACLAIRAGARWVACNDDRTLAVERGLVPGNGAMVTALRAATDLEPLVAGKPQRPLVDAAVARTGARRPLLVGDRLDTDIEAACGAGLDSLLVLTGVSDPAELLAAPAARRPRYVAADLAALHEPAEASRIAPRPAWSCAVTGPDLVLRAEGTDGDPLDALRSLCAARWGAGGGPGTVRAGDDAAASALAALGLLPAGTAPGTGAR